MFVYKSIVSSGTGRLKMATHPYNHSLKKVLPPDTASDQRCLSMDKVPRCFAAGMYRYYWAPSRAFLIYSYIIIELTHKIIEFDTRW